jgi:hypothetical protein
MRTAAARRMIGVRRLQFKSDASTPCSRAARSDARRAPLGSTAGRRSGESGEGNQAATRLARYSSSHPAVLRRRRTESFPGALRVRLYAMCPAGYEIGWGVVGSDVAFVVAKDHVHDPVQGVLDGPVGADDRADHSSRQLPRAGGARVDGSCRVRYVASPTRRLSSLIQYDLRSGCARDPAHRGLRQRR